MDKLRALEYFVVAAEEQSFSGAGRRLSVSAAAVSKLITALEARLAVSLFERHSRGLALTSHGATYLNACRTGLQQLQQADELLSASTQELKGTVVVGVQHVVAWKYLLPALPGFLQRHPDIHIDLRDFTHATDDQTRGVDVCLRMGWVEPQPDMVTRRLATGCYHLCASPAYWAANGMPQHPRELVRHNCLVFRDANETALDLWEFVRHDEVESVVVRGQVVFGNAHAFAARQLAIAGAGVTRTQDLDHDDLIAKGILVPAMTDWQSKDRPPVTLLYRGSVRRVPRVRCFIDFLAEMFRELEARRDGSVMPSARPHWLRRAYERASVAPRDGG
jgi:DNA-binding transcriptional LysR family regulator